MDIIVNMWNLPTRICKLTDVIEIQAENQPYMCILGCIPYFYLHFIYQCLTSPLQKGLSFTDVFYQNHREKQLWKTLACIRKYLFQPYYIK